MIFSILWKKRRNVEDEGINLLIHNTFQFFVFLFALFDKALLPYQRLKSSNYCVTKSNICFPLHAIVCLNYIIHNSLRGWRWKGRGKFGRARERESPNSLLLPFRTPATQAIFIMMLKKWRNGRVCCLFSDLFCFPLYASCLQYRSRTTLCKIPWFFNSP